MGALRVRPSLLQLVRGRFRDDGDTDDRREGDLRPRRRLTGDRCAPCRHHVRAPRPGNARHHPGELRGGTDGDRLLQRALERSATAVGPAFVAAATIARQTKSPGPHGPGLIAESVYALEVTFSSARSMVSSAFTAALSTVSRTVWPSSRLA